MKKRYKIAEIIIEVTSAEDNDVWAKLEWNYQPFEVEDISDIMPAVSIDIKSGLPEATADRQLIFKDIPENPDMLKLYVYRDSIGNMFFKTIQPKDTQERAMLMIAKDGAATVFIEDKDAEQRPWQTFASMTSCLQLAYHFAAQRYGALLSHASSVLKDGMAYLFLGKSGTGKSTHSRMWKNAFADTVLLNDDHPIVRVHDDGKVIAYGSPWSGKTPCYKNISAPIGGIVRICRGKTNSIRSLSTLEAFASISPSIFGTPFDRTLSDVRHKALEGIIASVPCYELHCLPDTEAAIVCHAGVTSKS